VLDYSTIPNIRVVYLCGTKNLTKGDKNIQQINKSKEDQWMEISGSYSTRYLQIIGLRSVSG